MSGLLVTICKDPREKISFSQFKLMTDTLYHRGPDYEGYVIFYNGKVFDFNNLKGDTNLILKSYYDSSYIGDSRRKCSIAFGFRGLSILDLSNLGHQPMNYLNRYWIVFDGAIYNFKELKIELIRLGYFFKSETDTEIITAAYDYWGLDCFNKFNGMWAFIIYDIKEDKIIVSRDRFGIKPLYYFEDKNKIIIASEIKAIHKAELSSKIIDLEKTRLFLSYGDESYSTDTILTNIKRFPTSSYSIISLINPHVDYNKIFKYWALLVNNEAYSFDKKRLDEYLNIYRELLRSSVKLRLRADVEVGITLSGGLDSSSILYFMLDKNESQSYLPASFSNVYKDNRLKEIDESLHINYVTDFLKVNNHKITPMNESVFDDFSEMIYYSDLPTNSSNISGWYTYKLIKQNGKKITLDGWAADVMFAGSDAYYKNYFKELKIKSFLYELIKTKKNFPEFNPTKMILFKTLISFPENSWWNPFKFYSKQHNLSYLSLNESLAYVFTHKLLNGLRYIDSMSMAHSIESRHPFLDYRLVEFAFKLNQSYKISQGWTKYICRLAMSGILPDEVVWRKEKMGWPNADELWFGEIHKDKVRNLLTHSKLLYSILTSKKMKDMLKGKFNPTKMRALSIAMWEKSLF